MEIIILPYMAISFSIGWAIFSPFAEIEDLQQWTFARIETSDLFATFLPFCLLWPVVTWATPTAYFPVVVLMSIAVTIFMVTLFGFVVGLFLLAKIDHATPVKRMAIIGIIIPLGSLLTLAWIAFPLWAFAGSSIYAIPAVLAVIPITLVFRGLSDWACRTRSR
jgi:hypothetical protein